MKTDGGACIQLLNGDNVSVRGASREIPRVFAYFRGYLEVYRTQVARYSRSSSKKPTLDYLVSFHTILTIAMGCVGADAVSDLPVA